MSANVCIDTGTSSQSAWRSGHMETFAKTESGRMNNTESSDGTVVGNFLRFLVGRPPLGSRRPGTPVELLRQFLVGSPVFGVVTYFLRGGPLWTCIIGGFSFGAITVLTRAVAERRR